MVAVAAVVPTAAMAVVAATRVRVRKARGGDNGDSGRRMVAAAMVAAEM